LHRKGITAALLFVVLLLGGCGGGGDGGSSATVSTSASPNPASTTTEAQLPKEAQAELREAEAKVARERKAQAKEQSTAAQPPHIAHHDSGGGSAQFKTKGGDNSIPEYGEEASDAEREAAASSLHAYLDSLAAHRWAAACSYMSLGLAAGLERLSSLSKEHPDLEGCPEILAALNGRVPQSALDAAAQADVASLRIEDDRGMALYRGAGGQGYAMPMAREEGGWRVAALAGTPAL
jgi:hypothetical protein